MDPPLGREITTVMKYYICSPMVYEHADAFASQNILSTFHAKMLAAMAEDEPLGKN